MRDLAFWKTKLENAEKALIQLRVRPLFLRRGVPWPPADPGAIPRGRFPKLSRGRLRLTLKRFRWSERMRLFRRYEKRRVKLEKQIAFYQVQIERVTARSHRILFGVSVV